MTWHEECMEIKLWAGERSQRSSKGQSPSERGSSPHQKGIFQKVLCSPKFLINEDATEESGYQHRVGRAFLGIPQDNTHFLQYLPLLPVVCSGLVIGEVVNGSAPTKMALVLGEGGTQPEVLRD